MENSNNHFDKKYRLAQKKQVFLEAFENNMCHVSKSCRSASISRQCYYDWRGQDKEFNSNCDDVEFGLIDLAENQLLTNIKKGKEASLFFYLCNKLPNKWRNIQRIEHTGKEGAAIELSDIRTKLISKLDSITPTEET